MREELLICNNLIGAIKYSNTIILDEKTKKVLLNLLNNRKKHLEYSIADCDYWRNIAKHSDPIERC